MGVFRRGSLRSPHSARRRAHSEENCGLRNWEPARRTISNCEFSNNQRRQWETGSKQKTLGSEPGGGKPRFFIPVIPDVSRSGGFRRGGVHPTAMLSVVPESAKGGYPESSPPQPKVKAKSPYSPP
jgi:hypothetical protein